MMKNRWIFLVLGLCVASSSAWASGLSKPVNVGPKAIGMGGAFVGIADDPTAIYHNPAGMAQMKGYQFEVGFDSLITDLDYTPDQTAAPGAPKEKAKTEFLPVPQFGFVTDVGAPVYLGLGLFFPHGNGGKFPATSSVPTNPDEGRIYSMEISPAMALELFEGMSIGGSLRIVRIAQSLKNQPFAVGPVVDMLEDLDVTGWTVGGSLGALYKPCRHFSIGANWRSKVSTTLDGDATFTTLGTPKVSLSQVLPMLFTAGIGISPVEKLTVGLSYGFERNSEIKNMTATLAGLGTVTIPQNWKDSHTLHVGAEYQALEALAIRAGYAKDFNASIPDTAMNRILGDIAAHEVSAGLAYKWSRYTFAGTWNGRFGTRTIPVSATNPSPGKYEAFLNSLSFAVQAAL